VSDTALKADTKLHALLPGESNNMVKFSCAFETDTSEYYLCLSIAGALNCMQNQSKIIETFW
jgi:hypothetical protein